MPSGKNWLYFLYINIAFGIYIAGIFYYNQVAYIQQNWPTYRCNPIYMPLADDVESNFVYCVQNSMSSFMGFLLEPLTFLTSSLGNMSFGFMNEINMIRAMFNKVRTLFSSIIQTVFGVFLNIIIEFQKIIIGIKDLMGKSIGILVTLIYTIDGSLKTMQSAWNGPTGQLVKALGSCFHPETKVKLKNGDSVYMKDLNLGDILSSGSIVRTILKIDNYKKLKLYEIKLDNDENVYVTGSHFILDKSVNNYIPVEEYKKSKLSNKNTDWFVCLVTSDNKISIENETFWDWEDDKFSIDYFNKYLSRIKLIN
jgi:hypothetical protein